MRFPLRWLVLLVLLVLFAGLGTPLLLRLRPLEAPAAAVAAGLALAALWRLRAGPVARGELLFVLGLAAAIGLGARGHWARERVRQRVQAADATRRKSLGRHVIAGFHSWDEARSLAALGVGGIFLTQRNVVGLSFAEVRERLAALQRLRRERGLQPLLVAADQEGEPVSRLSPPLTALPPLSTLVAGDRAGLAERVSRYAEVHGRELAALGVHVNLGPVVDLRPEADAPSLLDRKSRITWRAISGDKDVVAEVTLTYARTLRQHGVWATAKHFPGLQRVQRDTHYLPGALSTPLDMLRAEDWAPFRVLAARGDALVMLAHVRVQAVDREHLATASAALVQGVIRGEWRHEGVLITDDLCMAPAYYGPGGIGGAAVAALNAGIDLILVSYDGAQVPVVLDALLRGASDRAAPSGAAVIDPRQLARSDERLDRLRLTGCQAGCEELTAHDSPELSAQGPG